MAQETRAREHGPGNMDRRSRAREPAPARTVSPRRQAKPLSRGERGEALMSCSARAACSRTPGGRTPRRVSTTAPPVRRACNVNRQDTHRSLDSERKGTSTVRRNAWGPRGEPPLRGNRAETGQGRGARGTQAPMDRRSDRPKPEPVPRRAHTAHMHRRCARTCGTATRRAQSKALEGEAPSRVSRGTGCGEDELVDRTKVLRGLDWRYDGVHGCRGRNNRPHGVS